ncbi:MAG: nucleotidyl transferase AbiEii/AbiGii toxin family protein [Gammaproteobacteria bacterium]|nr:nucleotidyl transferase AbiEii/AbiGii toxin family protein [Gammaproteobacteria bacterium]
MSLEIIKHRLATYQCETNTETEQALREITQEIILMELSRHDFFSKAEFHGGTALRILYGLQRFSEDLDFALLKPNVNFSLLPYLNHVTDGLRAFGYDFEIQDRSKANNAIKKAFLKDDSLGKVLVFKNTGPVKKMLIKLEVDSNPPLGAITEIKQLLFPSPFSITAKNPESSFSGKLHALLCRNYVKGRDWYDLIWYVSQKTKINYELLENALHQNGPWKNQHCNVDAQWIVDALNKKIGTIDWPRAMQDVMPFIKSHQQTSLKLWRKEFFHDVVQKMRDYL